MLVGPDLLELFVRELELCRVERGENIVILAEPRSYPEYIAASFSAARVLGANPLCLTLPGGSPATTPTVRTGTGFGLKALQDNPLALDLLKAVDMVIDVTLEGFIHSPVLGEILGTAQFAEPDKGADGQKKLGARVLYICEPPEILARSLPVPEDKERALAALNVLKNAKKMHVTSDAGTDLEIDLTDHNPGYQCGFADEPGRWDHWPSCMVLTFPDLERVNGTIVMKPGDVLFPFKEFVKEPIRFTIEQGRVAKVEGGVDAAVLNRYMDDAGDPATRLVSHFGWGLSRTADWTSLGMYNKESIMGMEARCFQGNFMWSTGPNNFVNRYTPFHLDFPMRDCTITLDGVTVVDRGQLV